INGTFTVCQGFNASLTATAGYNNYQWSSGQNANAISPAVGGTYTVTVTDGNACTGSASQLVVVNANPVPVIAGTTAICAGASSTFDAGAGYAGYQWSGGLGSNQTINIATTGVYTVTVTDNNGCIGTTSQSLTVNANPVALITGDFDACQGATATLNANPGMTLYNWSSGQASATINPGTAGQYTVTITDGNGCTGTTFEDVTIYQNPVPSIAGTFEVCQGFAATLNASPGYPGYSWSSGSASATINPTINGTYTVTVTDLNSCTGSASQLVTVNANPVPVIAGNNVVCDGTTTTFDAGSYSSYVWSDGSGGQTITIGTAGTYTVTVTDGNGCVGTTSQTLTVNAIPTGSIFGSTAICFGDQTPLYFNFTGAAPFTFSYSDGTNTFGPLNSAGTTIDLPVTPNTSTTYTLVALNDNNCPGTFVGTVDIIVNQLPVPTITGDLEICDGDSSTLSASAGFVDYLWSNGTNAPDNTLTVGGNYSVTVTDLNGCQGTTAVNFTVNQTPVASFTHVPSSDCNTPRTFFTNTSTYPPLSQFTWTFGDSTTSNQTNPTHIYEEQGTYTATLYIMTTAGCADTVSDDVEVIFYPLAEADFKFDPEFVNVFNGKVQFTDLSQNAVAWAWDFGDGGSIVQQNPYHYFNEVGDFPVTLTVLNINGCPDSKTRMVMVNPFYVPNAFSPNDDGVNDFFFNAGYDLDVTSFEMVIFNRWGQRVYVTDSWLKFWNGLDVDNKPAPEGVYAYSIKVVTRGGKEHTFHGTTTLVR
ncbi:MAG: PKD domain-containing protein, partial [Bacteroidota bacterium]